MKSSSRRILNLVIGIGLAAVLIWLFFKDANWTEVGRSISSINFGLLAVAFVFQMLSILVKSWRWQLMLTPIKSGVPIHSCWKYFNIGFACTSLLPGRVGELLRPLLLAREQEIKFTPTFATIVAERVIDLLMVLLMFSTIFIIPGILGPNPDHPGVEVLKLAGLAVLGVSLVAMIFLVMIKVKTEWAVAIVRFFTKPLPDKISEALINLIKAFADGLGGLRKATQITGLVVSSVLAWFLGSLFFYFALQAFGIEVSVWHTIFLQAATAIGVIIPTPAGSGGYHGAVILVVGSLWGFPETGAQAFALLSHLLIFGSMTIIGVIYLATGGINIFKAVDQVKTAEQSQENTGSG